MVSTPPDKAVTRPVLLTVAINEFDEDQIPEEVTLFNCNVLPAQTAEDPVIAATTALLWMVRCKVSADKHPEGLT